MANWPKPERKKYKRALMAEPRRTYLATKRWIAIVLAELAAERAASTPAPDESP